jgi:hypothetical protein
VRESWQSRVPAVFVYEGRVYDAMVRYQGSRWGRLSSVPIPSWPYPGPMGGPTPVKAMSWSIKLPRYAPKIDGTRTVLLNKMTYGCPNLAFPVGFRLYKAAGIPTADARYARFYVNGGYYHYAMQLDHLDDLWAAALEPAGQPPGDLLKSTGCTCDEGPWGWGDERVLQPFCNYSKEQRYATTYKRYTYEWRGGKDVMALIEGLDAARKAGGQTLRAYLADNFDVDLVLAQIAIRNWAGTSDDMFQNHFLYRRPKDGKWVVVPYDLELEFGDRGGVPPTASFYIGEEGNPNNRSMWWNYLKDAFFKAYRAEYGKKLAELSTTILEPGNFAKVVDESATLFSVSDLMQAASKQMSCDVPGQVSKMKKWALDRDASLKAGIH